MKAQFIEIIEEKERKEDIKPNPGERFIRTSPGLNHSY
jgi:hypothetical protein